MHLYIIELRHHCSVPKGHQQWNFLTFSRLFPDQVPIFTDFLQHENMIFWSLQEIALITQMQKKCCSDHFYVPYQLNYGLTYKTNVIEIRFLIFVHFLSITERLSNHNHDIDSHDLEWGLHIDIYSIFSDFFLTFSWISTFPDPYQNLLSFSWLFKIFTFFLTFSWPVGTLH